MVEFKIVLSQNGKSKQIEVNEDVASNLIGKKLGEKVNGELFDLAGYEFEITGGSDSAGKPMRADLEGAVRKRILAVSGVGVHKKLPGMRQRKLVSGNTIYEKTAQVNMKVVKAGKVSLFEEPKAEEASEPVAEN
jgi:small subunit ribosomal protein S6e